MKELCNAGEAGESDEEPSPTDQDETTTKFEEQASSDQMKIEVPQERQNFSVAGGDCDLCHKTYSCNWSLSSHKQSVHQGVKYACDKYDYQATTQANLTVHIQSKHDWIKYACDQCDYQATRQSYLNVHIQSKHEGVKYSCDQCDYQASQRGNLRTHIKSKHEYVKYS